jgi:hypothetical protein
MAWGVETNRIMLAVIGSPTVDGLRLNDPQRSIDRAAGDSALSGGLRSA